MVFIATMLMLHQTQGSCWDDWSRCSGWSSSMTGVLWKPCDSYCKSKGKAVGNCREVPNTCALLPASVKVNQCQCW